MRVSNMMLPAMAVTVFFSGRVYSSVAGGGAHVLDVFNAGELEPRNTCRIASIPKMCTGKATIGGVTTTLTYKCPEIPTAAREKQTVYVTVTEFTTLTPPGGERAKLTLPPVDATRVISANPTSTVTLSSASTIVKTITARSKSSSAAMRSSISDSTTDRTKPSRVSPAMDAIAAISVSSKVEELIHLTTTSTSYVTVTAASISSKTPSDHVESTLLHTLRVSNTSGFLSSPGSSFNSTIFIWPSPIGNSYSFDRHDDRGDKHDTGTGHAPLVTSITYVTPNASTVSPHKPTLSTSPSASLQGTTGNVKVSLVVLSLSLMTVALLVSG